MSSEEKKKILQMVEDGAITAEEAMKLIKVLEQPHVEDEIEVIEPGAGSKSEYDASDFDEVKARARKYIAIPLAIGTVMTVLAAYWMFALTQDANYGFWFVCAWFPLLLGILLVALSSGGMNSRWVYVDVKQKPGERPQRITLGFPIPFGLVNWGIRNFGHYARGVDQEQMVSVLAALDASESLNEPLIVNVDEGDDGDRVQVYIG